MRIAAILALALFSALTVPVTFMTAQPVMALEAERHTVYCADERIEIATWDLEQMKVRRGLEVCQLASYTSSGDALRFAEENFGGEDADCSC
jgi:hypothetical protein